MIFWKIFFKIYEKAAEKMVREIEKEIAGQQKILDVGCGSGILAKKIQEKLRAEIIGIDIVDHRLFPIPFQIFDGKKIPFPDNYFDVAIISFVLHHTDNPKEILEETKRVAKKIIIFEDIAEKPWEKLRCYFHFFTWNLFFGKSKKFNFFGEKEWKEIFFLLNLKTSNEKNFYPPLNFLDPIKRKIFVLTE